MYDYQFQYEHKNADADYDFIPCWQKKNKQRTERESCTYTELFTF